MLIMLKLGHQNLCEKICLNENLWNLILTGEKISQVISFSP